MTNEEAIKFLEEYASKIDYRLECALNVPCRSFYDKISDAIHIAVLAIRERDAAVKDLESLMNEVVAAEACRYCINNGTTKCGIRYTPRAFCDAKWRGADHDE